MAPCGYGRGVWLGVGEPAAGVVIVAKRRQAARGTCESAEARRTVVICCATLGGRELRSTGADGGGVVRADRDRRQRMGPAGKRRQPSYGPAQFTSVGDRYRMLTEWAPGVMINPTPSGLVSKRLQDSLPIRSCWALWIMKCDHCGRSTPGHEKARCPGETNQSSGLRQLSGRRDLNPRPPDPQWRPLRTVCCGNGESAGKSVVVECRWVR